MSLRDGAIEAMAAGVERDCDLVVCPTPAQHVFAALDALLDYLTAHADEWFDAWTAWSDEDGDPKFVGLLAVLGTDE